MTAPAVALVRCAAPDCENDITQRVAEAKTRPPRYCDIAECQRSRAAERQVLTRARGFNALARVILELPEQKKRVTTEEPEDDGFRWDQRGGGTCWGAIAQAWSPRGEGMGLRVFLASRGPEIKWHRTDLLMQDAERRVRSVHCSAGTPHGQLRSPQRTAAWESGEKEYTIHREGTGDVLCPGVPGDAGQSAGELWLSGKQAEAELKTKGAHGREWTRCEGLPSGYLMGGTFWKLEVSPPRPVLKVTQEARDRRDEALAALPDGEPWRPARHQHAAPENRPKGPFHKVDLRDDEDLTPFQQTCKSLLEANGGRSR